ncbi:MAG TPA: acetyl-CoA carboxylase biotin carboxyl carrier protein subunit [Flavobacterium sp.]|uniref:acetyl-CoA carboxylase biotin carboxyl carrier protein subunit n=1 Tax=unclassified Flavobacterium TaxID=196869 RepID=UPI0025C0E88D|nr:MULTISPECIES: acetyl-CoA carboxylase biotin carboxyl carrier protein subunit [unclassified Flavobacterium]HRE76883.1 acetyl-CoA carboxylase biotin carboxyl carrier protein subunit [Flavobacterium sp.]
MNQKFRLSVNQSATFEKTEQDLSQLDAISTSPSEFHILHNHKPFSVKISEADFLKKTYTVEVNQNSYTVVIENPLDILIKEMGFEVGKSKQINAIKAPMPGLILEINVSVGQEVKEGDNLIILEAMKMENSFASPRDGIIKSITVSKGDAVDKGQLLIEFE